MTDGRADGADVRSIRDARIAKIARDNGCRPLWWPPYGAYCCGCDDLLHAGDQQCSIISEKSARKRRG